MYSRGMGSSIDPFAPDRPNARDRNLYESFDASVGVLLFCASVACVLWTPAWFYFSLVVRGVFCMGTMGTMDTDERVICIRSVE